VRIDATGPGPPQVSVSVPSEDGGTDRERGAALRASLQRGLDAMPGWGINETACESLTDATAELIAAVEARRALAASSLVQAEGQPKKSTRSSTKHKKAAKQTLCKVCSGDLKNPAMYNCGHYFCRHCIERSPRNVMCCPWCGADPGKMILVPATPAPVRVPAVIVSVYACVATLLLAEFMILATSWRGFSIIAAFIVLIGGLLYWACFGLLLQ